MIASRRKVLVTGAGGFIGKNLVRDQLARGHGVTAVDVDLAGLRAMKLDGDLACEQLDIRSAESLRRRLEDCDRVFHLAAAHLDVLRDERWFYEVNVRATGELARLAAEAGVRRFVHCSSVGVYGAPRSLPANEETPPAPDIAYERTKLEGEHAVLDASTGSAMVTVVLRPAWVYGPDCPRTVKLLRSVANRRFLFAGSGDNVRHPIYIDDMLEAFELAATKPLAPGEIVIVAGPDTVSVKRLVDLIIEALEMDYVPRRVPLWLMAPLCLAVEKAAALAGRQPPFSRRSLKFFTDSSAFDIGKAGRVLDFHPRVDTRQGLRLTIDSCRQQGLL